MVADTVIERRKRPRRAKPVPRWRYPLGIVSEPTSLDLDGEIRRVFLDHRDAAKRRGVSFLFTLEQWCAWWQFDIRWTAPGLYGRDLVMVRFGDAGPFAADNVYCCTTDPDGEFNRRVQRQTAT